jgi:hypothetical protein
MQEKSADDLIRDYREGTHSDTVHTDNTGWIENIAINFESPEDIVAFLEEMRLSGNFTEYEIHIYSIDKGVIPNDDSTQQHRE